ncbi:MAG: hypothetical protein JRI90_18200 [Deltaproteobacteria bacterium]|nr:hypothetical protein [Deltaproteobacteria bacterium]
MRLWPISSVPWTNWLRADLTPPEFRWRTWISPYSGCFDLKENIDAFLDRSPIVHLHGIADGMDHKGAENIDEASWGLICDTLADYEGSVVLEVFSLEDLSAWLQKMEDLLEPCTKARAGQAPANPHGPFL